MLTRVLLVALACSASALVHADCPMQKAEVSGRVHADDQPVAGASIEIRWNEQRNRGISSQTRSNADGSFELALSIDGFDGRTLLAKEKCGYLPDDVEIEVRHDGHADYTRNVDFKALSTPLDIELRAR